MVTFLLFLGFLLYNTFKDNDPHNRKKSDPEEEDNSSGNKLIEISKSTSVKSIPGLHKHEKRSLDVILRELPH
jgi:hypothetical protein